MAILSSIREKTGLMLIVVLGATIAFIAGDSIMSFLNGSGNQDILGEVNGEEISINDYDQLVNSYDRLTQGNREQAQGLAWQDLIFFNGWLPELKAAGVDVTRELEDETETSEEFDYLQGSTLHKYLLQQKQPGQSNEEFAEIIGQIIAQGPSNPSYSFINNQKEYYYVARLKDKFNSLFSQSAYVTTSEAKRNAEGEGMDAAKVSFEYVYLPFTSVIDSTIETSEQELETYLSDNANEFKNTPDNRSLRYVTLAYNASAEDRANAYKEANDARSKFITAESDQDFVNANADNPKPIQLQEYNAIPNTVKADSGNIKEGTVYPPLQVGKSLELYKVSQVRLGEGIYKTKISTIFVDTSRIADDKIPAALDSARGILGMASADSVIAASLQWSNSTDLESTDTLKMPKAVLGKIFSTKTSGVFNELITVPTGVLIVKKDENVSDAVTKYGIAKIDLGIIPSQITRDSVWQIASDLISDADGNLSILEDSVKTIPGLRLESAQNFPKTATSIGRFSDPEVKAILSWAYQNPVGSISGDIYDLTTKETYMIVSVDGATEKNSPTVAGMKAGLETAVKNKKKAEQLKTILAAKTGELKTIAEDINKENSNYAKFNTVNDATLGMRYIPSFQYGFEPTMLGTAFGLTKGSTSNVIVGENGVFIIKTTLVTEAKSKTSYTAEKEAGFTQRKGGQLNKVNQAFNEIIDVNDERYKRY